jgi:hypothetical protein
MAELLVRAQSHRLDKLPQEEVDKMPVGVRRSYDARSQIGDIIVVRPDGWQWGRCECLPEYVVIKIPSMSVEDAKKYEEQLNQDEVVTKNLKVDKVDFDDEKKKEMFIKENRFTAVPLVIETADMMRIITVKTEDIDKQTIFKYAPEEVGGAKTGYTNLKGIVSVNTVEGQAIKTYLLRLRKHQVAPSLVGEENVIEVADEKGLNLTVKENTPITATVWTPEVK